jgi:AcrR family transcriptional regulator
MNADSLIGLVGGGTVTEDDPVGRDQDADQGAAFPRRGGRRQGISGTRQDIIRSARKLFAERGYQGATMRAIARDARVDAALIHHFFTSKEGIFTAAIGDAFRPEGILAAAQAPGPGTPGERLLRAFLAVWDDPESRGPMLAVVRSAVASDEAARMISDFVTTQVIADVVKRNADTHRELRTAMIGSLVIGLLMVRCVIRIEPLAGLDQDTVLTVLGPAVDRYLEPDLDVGADA